MLGKIHKIENFSSWEFCWMDSPNILFSWSRLLTLYSSMRRGVNITHPHSIHLTENKIIFTNSKEYSKHEKGFYCFEASNYCNNQWIESMCNQISVSRAGYSWKLQERENPVTWFLMDSWILLVDNIAKDNELLDFVIKKNLIRRIVDPMMLIIFSECP